MKNEIKIEKHPKVADGFYVTDLSGRIWSCVNLETRAPGMGIGEMYDTVGGRFEAMTVPDYEHQIRASSFEELFKEIENY